MSNAVPVIARGLYLAAYWPLRAQVICGQFDAQVLTKATKQLYLGI